MFRYTFGVEFVDGETGSVSVEAESIPAAKALAAAEPNVAQVGMLYGSFDLTPQVFLAW